MKIKDVEIIPIYPRLARRYETRKVDLYGIDARTVFRVTTDNGPTGYGDQRVRPWGQPAPDKYKELIGSNPFDFVNNLKDFDSGLNCALYDVMGKHLDIPAYKLMGQKLRDWIPVAAWTRPASPLHFQQEIQRAAAQGYRVFKIHTSSYFDVFEQTKMAEQVAPPGFKIHYDFNSNRSIGVTIPIIKELERNHPVVGYIEDPLKRQDIDGWRRVREATGLPTIMHGTPFGGIQEIMHSQADIYMIAGSMGDLMATGLGFGKANLQVILQFEGGTLGKAMAMHMASVLPTHTAHSINLDDQYEEDITTERIPVVEGSSPVPDGPGLGFDVDEDALRRLSEQQLVEPPKHVGILTLPYGARYYGPSYISPTTVTGREEGDIRGFKSELWEDDGTEDFNQVYNKVQENGVYRVD
jgi:L-alanine-DL-glutamate epimerase-like enolase superfamily enzyme